MHHIKGGKVEVGIVGVSEVEFAGVVSSLLVLEYVFFFWVKVSFFTGFIILRIYAGCMKEAFDCKGYGPRGGNQARKKRGLCKGDKK